MNSSDKLHLGCFDCPVDGWLNTDITPHIWISKVPFLADFLRMLGKMDDRRLRQHRDGVFKKVRYLNLGKPLPCPENSFRFVFSSHVFEHIPRRNLPGLLREILRVLRPGGILRVSVPDLSVLVARYVPERADDFVHAVFEIEQGHEKNRHQWMYCEPTLRKVLETAGFVDVRHCAYRKGECPDLDLLDNRPDHSLFLEASKAGGA